MNQNKPLRQNIMKRILASAICVLGMATMGNAALITYIGSDDGANSSDPRPNSIAAAASFDAAAASIATVSTIDFESAPVGAFSNLLVGAGVTIDGNDANNQDQRIENAPTGLPDRLFGYNTTAGGQNFASMFGGTLTFSFIPGINSFGGYFSGLQLSNLSVTFFDGTNQTVDIPTLSSGIAFVGFTDVGKNISSVTVNAPGDIIAVDDVRFGRAAAVPEPTSLALLGMGVASLGGYRLRRKRA